jgi:hypothetical protein
VVDANGPAHPIHRLSGSESLPQWAANRDCRQTHFNILNSVIWTSFFPVKAQSFSQKKIKTQTWD